MTKHKLFWKSSGLVYIVIILICSFTAILVIRTFCFVADEKVELIESDPEAIEYGVHLRTGLVEDIGMREVIFNCTNCHSAELVTQNRMTKKDWLGTIRWMQETQNLWDLGDNEQIILDYLAKNYAPKDKGRREMLKDVEWYLLE
jgi:hypothetical protein